jgi:hypothetical protein
MHLVSRFTIAMGLYVLLAIAAVLALTDKKIRGLTLIFLAFFAFRTWLHHRKAALADSDDENRRQ